VSALHGRMGGQYAVAGALVMVSLAASLLIVPNPRERAAMHLRDREFDAARMLYEERLAREGPQLDNVAPLARLYAQRGELDRAIAILVDLIVSEGLDTRGIVDARRLLSTYLKWAGRHVEHRTNLAEMARLDPVPETLRELAALYNFEGETGAQIGVLERLAALPSALPDDLVDLAELKAARRDFRGAERALADLAERMPDSVDAAVIDLWLVVALEAGDRDLAVEVARAHLARRNEPVDVAAVVGAFAAQRVPVLGLAALAPVERRLGRDVAVNVALMRLALDAEKPEIAASLFDRQLAGGTRGLAPARIGDLIDVGLASGRIDAALALARTIDIASLGQTQLEGVAFEALERRQIEFLRVLAAAGGDRLDANPLLAARVYLELGDRTRALAAAARAARDPALPLEASLTVVQVFAGAGRPAEALALLARVADDPALPETAIVDLAQLYLLLDRAADGTAVFERLRARRPTSLAAATGWALVLAQAGRGEAVARWLETASTGALPGPVLTDLFFIGGDAKVPALQLAAARRLLALEGPTPTARLRLAQAALAAGRAGEAIAAARVLRAESPSAEIEALYRDALFAAARTDAVARGELRDYWRARLADGTAGPATREEALYALIEARDWATVLPDLARRAREAPVQWLGAFVTASVEARRVDLAVPVLLDVARRADLPRAVRAEALFALVERTAATTHLPALERAAGEFGGEWQDAYEAALERLGRRDALRELVARRAADPALPADQRRALAFRLLDLGDKPAALGVFQRLAEGGRATAPDAQQVLFLLGPRPVPAQLDWIEAQARAASGPARVEWARALLDAGAPRRAAFALESEAAIPGRVGGGASVLAAEAYLAAGTPADRTALARILEARIPREGEPANARRLGEIAFAAGRADLARAAYSRLFLLDPAQRDAQRQVGFFAFGDGDFERARTLLARFLAGAAAGEPADWEAHYYLGESHYRLRDRAAAREQHALALAAIEKLAGAPFAARAAQAYLYYRLGRTEESVALYARLVREQPQNRDLRADYAGVLLELGRTAAARAVLEPRS